MSLRPNQQLRFILNYAPSYAYADEAKPIARLCSDGTWQAVSGDVEAGDSEQKVHRRRRNNGSCCRGCCCEAAVSFASGLLDLGLWIQAARRAVWLLACATAALFFVRGLLVPMSCGFWGTECVKRR